MKLNFIKIMLLASEIPNADTLLMSQKTYDENIKKFKNGYYKKLKIEIAENADDNRVWIYCAPNLKDKYKLLSVDITRQ
jgi:hypothetical protein